MLYYLLLVLLMPVSLFSSGIDKKLAKLEQEIQRELELLDYPQTPWRPQDDTVCDVAIIGGGMLGTAVAYSLQLEGITNVRVFDAEDKGKEGPWLTYARMKTLRSGKSIQGPALGISGLTFRAWYEAQYGIKAWKRLDKIPTRLWGNYLVWMKKVLKINVENRSRLQSITSDDTGALVLQFEGKTVRARKVVLATGRGGFGGYETPSFLKGVPKKYWAHTSEVVTPAFFKNKHVVVIGAGASAFDSAAYVLEQKAQTVVMLMRREVIPKDNYFAQFGHNGFKHGYYFLSDDKRCELFVKAYTEGIPPPLESIKRVQAFPQFELFSSTCIDQIVENEGQLAIQTNHGPILTDFIFLGTGYAVDGSKQQELAPFSDKILLWQDRLLGLPVKLGRFPYLGPNFEFLEKELGSAPYLQHIHCFNYGAFLSHGRISGDIDCIEVGIKRLVQGIAVQLFLEQMQEDNPYAPNCPNSCQTGLENGFCKGK